MPPTNQELNSRKATIICQQYAEDSQDYRQSMKELTRIGLSDEAADQMLAQAKHGYNEQALRDAGTHPGQLPGEADAPLPGRATDEEDPDAES